MSTDSESNTTKKKIMHIFHKRGFIGHTCHPCPKDSGMCYHEFITARTWAPAVPVWTTVSDIMKVTTGVCTDYDEEKKGVKDHIITVDKIWWDTLCQRSSSSDDCGGKTMYYKLDSTDILAITISDEENLFPHYASVQINDEKSQTRNMFDVYEMFTERGLVAPKKFAHYAVRPRCLGGMFDDDTGDY